MSYRVLIRLDLVREAELARILAISEGEDNERKRREEEDRKKLDQSNTNALFDDSFQL